MAVIGFVIVIVIVVFVIVISQQVELRFSCSLSSSFKKQEYKKHNQEQNEHLSGRQLPDESPEVVLEVLVLDTQLLQLPPGAEQR